MFRKLIAITALITAPLAAFAGPLDLSKIPADAKWAVHLDAASLLNSQSATTIIEFLQSPACKDIVNEKNLQDGLARARQAESVILYGKILKEGNGVLVYQGEINMEEVNKMIESGKSQVVDTYRTRTIRSWKGGAFSCIANDRTAVISKSLGQLKEALDVMDGMKDSLQGSKSILAEKLSGLSPALVAFAAQCSPNDNLASMMLSKTKELTFRLSEDASGVHNIGAFAMQNEEDAMLISSFLTGIKSIAMFSTQMPAVTELAQRYAITTEGKVVKAELSYTAAEMTDWLAKALELVKNKDAIMQLKGQFGAPPFPSTVK